MPFYVHKTTPLLENMFRLFRPTKLDLIISIFHVVSFKFAEILYKLIVMEIVSCMLKIMQWFPRTIKLVQKLAKVAIDGLD